MLKYILYPLFGLVGFVFTGCDPSRDDILMEKAKFKLVVVSDGPISDMQEFKSLVKPYFPDSCSTMVAIPSIDLYRLDLEEIKYQRLNELNFEFSSYIKEAWMNKFAGEMVDEYLQQIDPVFLKVEASGNLNVVNNRINEKFGRLNKGKSRLLMFHKDYSTDNCFKVTENLIFKPVNDIKSLNDSIQSFICRPKGAYNTEYEMDEVTIVLFYGINSIPPCEVISNTENIPDPPAEKSISKEKDVPQSRNNDTNQRATSSETINGSKVKKQIMDSPSKTDATTNYIDPKNVLVSFTCTGNGIKWDQNNLAYYATIVNDASKAEIDSRHFKTNESTSWSFLKSTKKSQKYNITIHAFPSDDKNGRPLITREFSLITTYDNLIEPSSCFSKQKVSFINCD